jgi:hypothetical protein
MRPVTLLRNGAIFHALHYYSLMLGVNPLLFHLKALFPCDMGPVNTQTFKNLSFIILSMTRSMLHNFRPSWVLAKGKIPQFLFTWDMCIIASQMC